MGTVLDQRVSGYFLEAGIYCSQPNWVTELHPNFRRLLQLT